jgi:hypothetical protein
MIDCRWIDLTRALLHFVTAKLRSACTETTMLRIAGLLAFCCLALVTNTATGQRPQYTIRGTLRENGAPIVDATVYLQSFDNEDCAKLFTKKSRNEKLVKRLQSCMHVVSTTNVDATGNYRFTDLKAGWYAVHFLWNIAKKPKRFPDSEKEGSWLVMYAGYKDSTGKYDTMAQDVPFRFLGTEDVIRDFGY